MNINRLKDIRLDRDFKQIDIANVLGIKQQQYSEYERGIVLISIEKLNILADFYNTSVDYLIGRTDERKSYPKSLLK
jgi:transcriptional regulator with XRE-family HTH domain